MDLFCAIKSPSFIKERMEIEIFRFFNQFSKMWKISKRYNAERIGKRAEPCPTSMSILKNGEEKLF